MRRHRVRHVSCGLFILLAAAFSAEAQYYPQQYVSLGGLVSFPATAVGDSVTQSLQLTFVYSAPILSITVPSSIGGKQEFALGTVSGCVVDGTTVNPAGTVCTLPITFTPAYPGLRPQSLVVDLGFGSGPGVNTAVFGISGVALGPLAVVAPGTATLLQAGLATPSYQYIFASGMAVDGSGNAYAAVPNSQVVVEIDKDTGAVSTVVTGPYVAYPQAVAVDAAGDILVAYGNVVVVKPGGLNNGSHGLDPYASQEDGYGGPYGFSGDGGPAFYAVMAGPMGLALDSSTNTFIADTGNQRIRRVDATSGIITTYAGGGTVLGDGGAATSALLNSPVGVAIDASGNVYIADSGNNRVRKVTASTGIITTIAGNGTAGYTGDGGVATAAELSAPLAISLDAAGNLYIGDSGNQVVRKVDAATNTIYTIAGGGGSTLTSVGQTEGATGVFIPLPSGVVIDPAGSLLVASSANSQIYKIAPTAGAIVFAHQTLQNGYDTADDPMPVYLSNDGTEAFNVTAPLSGANPVLSSGFSVDTLSACQPLRPGATALPLIAGDTCVYGLDFVPPLLGTNDGTMTVTDSAPTATQTMSLLGTGGTASATSISLAFTYAPANYDPTYTSNDTLSATVTHASVGATSPVNGTVTFYADGTPLAGGSNIAVSKGVAIFNFTQLLSAGSHLLMATFTPATSSNLDTSTTSLSLDVGPAMPTIASLNIDNHIYDGKPHGVTLTTNPPGLTTVIYYEPTDSFGSSAYTLTAPTLPGTYSVQIEIEGTANYSTIYTDVFLHIYALPATVTINSLAVPYGTAVPAPTVTTSPAGLATTVYYAGSTTPPTAVGIYIMGAVITTPGYAADAGAILEIYSPTMTTSTWIVNQDSTVSHLSSSGVVTSTAGAASGASTLGAIAIDSSGDAWSVTNANNQVVEVSPSGALLGTYSGGGLLAPVAIAIDGLGNPWVVNSGNSLTVLSPSGTALSSTGYLATSPGEASPLATPSGIAIDATGSVWITNSGDSSITRVFGAAAPVLAPTVVGVAGSILGTRP